MVLKQREEVLAQIDAIMSGEKDASPHRQVEPAAEGDATAEDGEADEGEAEEGEADGEAEDEEVLELPDAGVGHARDADGMGSALAAIVGALAVMGLSVRRRFI